jgi:hypothetical protein
LDGSGEPMRPIEDTHDSPECGAGGRPLASRQEVHMPELTRRYIVMAMATEAPFDVHDPEAPFVLKPWKDPAALRALEAYREHCYPELAADLAGWIQAIRTGARIRGGVGARNDSYAAAARPKARVTTRAARRPARAAKRVARKAGKGKGKRRR